MEALNLVAALFFWKDQCAIVSESVDFAFYWLIPDLASHALGDRDVEKMAACSGEKDAAQQAIARRS